MTNEIENPFGCENQKDMEIKEASSYFKPEVGTHKIRFLAGPIKFYESQKFENNAPVGDKKHYAEDDVMVKKDKHAKLTLAYIIYDYEDDAIKSWTINSVPVLKQIRDVDDMNEKSDLSSFDCKFKKAKKGASKFFDYNLAGGQNSPFTNKDIIQEFIDEKPFDKLCESILTKIADTKADMEFEGTVEEGSETAPVEGQEANFEEATPAAEEVTPEAPAAEEVSVEDADKTPEEDKKDFG